MITPSSLDYVSPDMESILFTATSDTLAYGALTGASLDLTGVTSDLLLGAGAVGGTAIGGAEPALARLSTGGFAAVWQGSDAGLLAQLRDATGKALGDPIVVTPHDGHIAGQAAVTPLAGGGFAVVYVSSGGGADAIAYRVVQADGTVGAEHVLASGMAGDAAMPAVTTLSNGSFAVAWKSGGAVHVQQACADGTPFGAQSDYAALGSAFSPAIAALGAGGYVVSWGEMNDGNIYAATSTAHAPFIVSGDGYAASIATAAPLPHVAALAGGGFVVTWDSYINEPRGFTISDIFFQRYDSAGHALGGMVQANIDSTGGLYDAAVTATSDGGFAIAWQGMDADGFGIYGRRFGADGSALDAHEFQISQDSTGNQTAPDIVGLAGGGFVTAWSDTSALDTVSAEVRVVLGAAVPAAGTTQPAPAPAPVVTQPVVTQPVANETGTAGQGAASVNVPQMLGSAANDVLRASSGASTVDGQGGIDTLIVNASRAGSTIVQSGSGYVLTDAAGDRVSLTNVERVQFNDLSVALEPNGPSGQMFRMYQAAFNRAPDLQGLGYWIDTLDKGYSLHQVGAEFVVSAEFNRLYGANLSDTQFITAMYHNVLHREPDAEGYAYWIQALHDVSRGTVLTDFSESAEFKADIIGTIQNGIDYQHWS
jgi:hypothetical protein